MSSSGEEAYSQLLQTAACFQLSSPQAALVSGPDTLRYSSGRITQNIRDLAPQSSTSFMLLTPKGGVLALGQLAKTGVEDNLFFVAHGVEESTFARDFLQFKVADQLELESLKESHQSYYLLGPQALSFLEAYFSCSAETEYLEKENDFALRADAGSTPGVYILIKPDRAASFHAALEDASIRLYQHNDFEVSRISLRIPSPAFELKQRCIATDYPFEKYISFHKGCYSGQEVVEMSTARGRPNRKLLALAIDASEAVAVGAEISHEGKRCGFVSSSCFLPELKQSRVLAFVKYATPQDAQLTIGAKQCSVIS